MHFIETVVGLLKKIPRQVYSLFFLVVIVAFFGLYLRGIDWHSLEHLNINWWYFVAATVFATVFRYWGVMIWRYILIDLGAIGLPSFITLAYVYAKAWMGRYIPGTVTWIAGKVYMASSHGISKSRLAVASLLEGSMQVIALLIVSMLLLGIDPRLNVIPLAYKLIMVVASALLLFTLTPFVFNRLMKLAYRLVKKKDPGEELLINNKSVLRAFALYAVGSFIVGLSEFFVSRAVYPALPWHDFWFIVGAFNLSGALGILAIGVPSGLGVRDGAILLLLSAILPKEIALAITVSSRVWSSLADVVFFAVAGAVYRLSGSKGKNIVKAS